MKRLLILLLAGSCGLIWAQTNPPAVKAPPAKAKPAEPTEVDANSAEFDMGDPSAHGHAMRQVFYRGNVRVTDPKIKLNCEWLTLTLPADLGHVNYISAETNVVIDFTGDNGEQYHVTSARAVYNYAVVNRVTNETVTWTGNPIVTNRLFKIWSDPLVWDRRANKFFFDKNPRVVMPGGLSDGSTNNSALKLY